VARVLLGGCRASPGGLHLGHFYGTFHRVGFKDGDTLYFVISDCIDESDDVISRATVDIYYDIVAAAHQHVRMLPVRESRLRSTLAYFTAQIERVVPVTTLIRAHPHRKQIRTGSYPRSSGDFTFPIHQSAFLLGINPAFACFNDDNALVVELARWIARRLNQRFGSTLEAGIQLPPRTPGRLNSWDGRRMAKVNQNTLSLSAGDAAVVRFVNLLIGRNVADRDNFINSTASPIELCYLDLVGARVGCESYRECSGPDRQRFLVHEISSFLQGIRIERNRNADLYTGDDIRNQLTVNEGMAIRRIIEPLKGVGLAP